jgi:hypothetical protein
MLFLVELISGSSKLEAWSSSMLRTFRASKDPCPCFYNVFLQLKVSVHIIFLLEIN